MQAQDAVRPHQKDAGLVKLNSQGRVLGGVSDVEAEFQRVSELGKICGGAFLAWEQQSAND